MNLCSKYRPSCTDCTGHHPPISNLSLYVMPPTGLYTMVIAMMPFFKLKYSETAHFHKAISH